ncbi:MAG: lytic murein transglycosylase B [Burkholderiales bacterium]
MRRLVRLASAVALFAAFAAPGAAQTYADHPEARKFIAEMVERHGFGQRDLERLFADARYLDQVLTLITPLPPGERSWQSYRDLFVTQRRIEAGAQFWRRHARTLARAAETYGVPPEIVVAIIGVETQYGANTGTYRVLDALTTLAFDYPRRAPYFRSELEQFLLFVRESRAEAASVRGSYAGAIGIPQFMPGSIRRFAVDFDGDGRRDLRASPADAIGSVANFLRAHGWAEGGPIAVPARVSGERGRLLIGGGVDPLYRADELRELEVEFADAIEADTPAVLIELATPDAPAEYLVGFWNFYVLTRYNRSSFYAAAVLELARSVKAAHGSP